MGTQPISNLQPPIANKIALITGATRPPAPDLARVLAAQGWHVALNDLNPFVLDQLVQEITQSGGTAHAHYADIAQKLALQTILNDLEDAWGTPSLLINNTRVMPTMPLLDMDEWDWRRVLDVNLTGAFLLTQVVGRMMRAQYMRAQYMRARGGGTIIHLLQPDDGAGHSAYAATQAGVEGMARVAEKELAGAGVRVKVFILGEADDQFEDLQAFIFQGEV
jgi:3-oxoacyl-[acyl-carrier protein] reductase